MVVIHRKLAERTQIGSHKESSGLGGDLGVVPRPGLSPYKEHRPPSAIGLVSTPSGVEGQPMEPFDGLRKIPKLVVLRMTHHARAPNRARTFRGRNQQGNRAAVSTNGLWRWWGIPSSWLCGQSTPVDRAHDFLQRFLRLGVPLRPLSVEFRHGKLSP